MEKEPTLGLQEYLEGQLGSRELAQFYNDLLQEVALPWKENEPPSRKADLIVAFAFGQRRDLNGNALPDPVVSPRLKHLLLETVTRFNCTKGFVQWEIAEADGPPVPGEMKIVRPKICSMDATPIYLSTEGICKEAAAAVEQPAEVSVCVISHRHHAWRCVHTLRSLGFKAWARYEELPDQYDSESSQPWCRSASQYVIHDLIARLKRYEKALAGFS